MHGTTSLTKPAIFATLHCLTGCAIGEVLGMVIGTHLDWQNLPTIALSVALAFLFGYSLTFWPIWRSGMSASQALKIALAADTVSIVTMEIVDNLVMVAVPGAMMAGLDNWIFWTSLLLSLFIAFWITAPVNRWLIARGKGHAVAHSHHSHGHHHH